MNGLPRIREDIVIDLISILDIRFSGLDIVGEGTGCWTKH